MSQPKQSANILLDPLFEQQEVRAFADTCELESSEENFQLERFYQAAQYVSDYFTQPDLDGLDRALAPLYQPIHAVDGIGNQFAVRLMPAFLEPDVEKALEAFREISPMTIKQEMVLLAKDDQFRELHTGLHARLDETEEDMKTLSVERTKSGNGIFAEIDHNQFNDIEPRSLDVMLRHGVDMRVSPESSELIREAHSVTGDGITPIIEMLKNDNVLEVNGFSSSKISLAVHDMMDHVWTADLYRRLGLFEKYHWMFDSIGNPVSTDIFRREGEAIASIAFGVRYFQTTDAGFEPLINANEIKSTVEDMFKNGELDMQRHSEAFRIALSLEPGSREWQSLGFVYSNYLTELNEQRRKHGKIKQRDPHTRELLGELDPASPDYICFFIEAHHALLSSSSKHRNALMRFHILFEEYLQAYATGEITNDKPIYITPAILQEFDATQTSLPPRRIEWMNKNYGFTATREGVL